jgi:protoheme IX farnesyltransferase
MSCRRLLYPVQQYGDLCKVKVSVFNALSAVAGFLLSPSPKPAVIASLALSVFLLACGGAALNQYQERDIDALMERTRRRPIPAGSLEPRQALFLALALLGLALSILDAMGGVGTLLLGLFAILWYNGLYTYLKKKSAFAIIPGALIGAVPPAIGWVAGAGRFSDPRLWVISFLFFMWQVPHFWLLLLDHGKEYEKAGLPTPHALFKEGSMRRIIFHWIVALAVASLCVSLYGLARAPLIQVALFAAAVWIIWKGRSVLVKDGRDASRFFRMVNVYMFFIMLGIALNGIFAASMPSLFLLEFP